MTWPDWESRLQSRVARPRRPRLPKWVKVLAWLAALSLVGTLLVEVVR